MDIPLSEMLVWDPDLPMGGLTPQQIKMAKVLLWKGHCSVHQMFQAQHILRWRQQHPSGMVISHPECNFEVCKLSDYVGSTDYIYQDHLPRARRVRAGWSALNSIWSTAWPLNSARRVNRCSSWHRQFACARRCSVLIRSTSPGRWKTWLTGKVVNQIKVPAYEAELARIALDRMLAIS